MYQLPLNLRTIDNSDEVIELGVHPLQATFRGGEDELLHLWYPLLEGYSPQFVEAIINTFAPSAQRILDPFAGTGTTPITVARMNRQAFYSEVNPLLQFLIQVKTEVYSLDNIRRVSVANEVRNLAREWHRLLSSADPDQELKNFFPLVFGSSKFFDDETFDTVLRARTVVDTLTAADRLVGDVLHIAVLASLLLSSELIRSGDIRYRTEKERERKVSFMDEVARRLVFMADDISSIQVSLDQSPTFLCEDARGIREVPFLNLDLVVTSPPYLNGTNYFRNAKIELWFMKILRTKKDLATFRYRAVTSGINDVTKDKILEEVPKPVVDVLGRIKEAAYDVRIPLMVLGYFQDMQRIFLGISRHLRRGATVAIDIGDSMYAGVFIPTDRILADILSEQGFIFEKEIVLRQRVSRDKTPLRQVLLILRYEGKPTLSVNGTAKLSQSTTSWEAKWSDFKQTLPHQKFPYSKRNWGNQLHSLCSYHGKMKPSLAHHLVNVFARPGGRILDPFSGVGTIPFEAALEGIKAYGFDISPAAVAISSAKLGTVKSEECQQVLDVLADYLEREEPTSEEYTEVQGMGFNGRIPDYFHPTTLKEILLTRRYFQANPPTTCTENMVFASLLHILHGNRPYALSRRSHPITPYKPTGETEYRALIPRLREKVKRSLEVERTAHFVPGTVFFQDATHEWPSEVDQLDAIITSPPFFDSTRFHIGNWMRLWFCGWNKNDFDEKPLMFVDELQKQSFSIYEPIFRQAHGRLKPDGVLVMHLGLSYKSDMASELGKIAQQWFTVADTFVEDVSHLETHGIRDKGTVTGHQFLVLTPRP